MNDCGKSASIRHELALCAVVELVQSMYGAPVVVLMPDYVRNTGECMAGRGGEGREVKNRVASHSLWKKSHSPPCRRLS